MKKILIPIVLLFIFVRCSVGPDYVKPTVEMPDSTIYQVQETTIEDSVAMALADTTWWELFGDTVLTSLITSAIHENNDVKIAAARVDEFMGLYGVAKSDIFPKFNVDADGRVGENNAQGQKFRANRFTIDLSAFWEIDIWGKIRRANESAMANLLASEEVRRGVILTVIAQVAITYFDLLSLDDQLLIAKQTVDSRAHSLKLFNERLKLGDISMLEVSQLESEYWYAVSQVPLIEKNIVQLENAMCVLLGRNPDPIPRGRNLNDLSLPEIPESLPSQILERRPDVQQAEQELISANANIGVVKSQYYPSLSLSGLIGYSSDDISTLFEPASVIWSAGANILQPLFRAGEISSQVESAEAFQRQTLYNYIKTVQTAFSDAQNALVERVKTEQIYYSDGKRLDALQLYYDLATMKYNEGATSYLEVLDAERSLFNSQLGYAQARATVLKSVVGIFSAFAGGWLNEISYEAYQPMNPVNEKPDLDTSLNDENE